MDKRPNWVIDLIKKGFPGRFGMAKLTHAPLVGDAIDRALFKGDDIIYLPSNRSVIIGEALPQDQNMVLPSAVVDHFVDEASTHWLMHTCICREASDCDDYPNELGCLFLGEAVNNISSQLGRYVTRDEAHAHLDACREAGLVHMIGRNRLDTVWTGASPGDQLMTICNCCPCCCLWRMLPHVSEDIGGRITSMPGVTISVGDECVGCESCTDGVCFVDAIHMDDGVAVISAACRGCGRCVEVCPEENIELVIDDDSYVSTTIGRLSALVDVSDGAHSVCNLG